ncbi:MAG: hypothetical protein LBU16_00205 [Treponema sp.]|jgi:hypothetical protein|nr:hypothetical protein [Treponema sp.]
MKKETRLLFLGALVLALLGGCDNDAGGDLPESPITFDGKWGDPNPTGSRFEIFKHAPNQGIPENALGAGSPAIHYPVPRVFTVNPDWTFTYTGGFSQAKISLGGVLTLYPRLVVKGRISYVEDQFYFITPTSATVDLTEISALAGANVDLPPETVASFQEYAHIYYDAGGKLVIDDMPQTITNGKGILVGTWTKQ